MRGLFVSWLPFLDSDSHRSEKIITVFVPSGRHLGKDSGTVEIGSLEPMRVSDVEIQVGTDFPFCAKLHILSERSAGLPSGVSEAGIAEKILALCQEPGAMFDFQPQTRHRFHGHPPTRRNEVCSGKWTPDSGAFIFKVSCSKQRVE